MKVKQHIKHFGFTYLVLFILCCVGCTQQARDKIFAPQGGDYESGQQSFPSYGAGEERPAHLVRRLPWETWPMSRDLQGHEIQNLTILQGDELLKTGYPAQSLERYRAAKKENMSPEEQESLTMRIASTELVLDQPERGLAEMSEYFRVSGRIVEDVDVRFSLLFAYAYGRKGDVNQSLAWFSRVNRVAGGQGGMGDAAGQGVRLLIRSLGAQEFDQAATQWTTDAFINGLIGKERLRRASRDYEGATSPATGGRFWEGAYDVNLDQISSTGGLTGSGVPVGVLLPLSGKFSRLGTSTRNGIELAILGQGVDANFQPVYRDTQGEEAYASAHIRELMTGGDVSVVLGPLISSGSIAVGDIARQNRISALVFSKRSDFETGAGIFRLGPTIDSQVQSLLDACYNKRGMIKYALIAPASPVGEEFSDTFREYAAQLNLDIVYEATYYPDDSNALVTIAAEVEASKVDGIFFPDSLDVAARFAGNLSEPFRTRTRLLGSARWDNPAALQNSRTVLEGSIFVSPFYPGSQRPVIGQFVRAYQARFSEEPDFLAAQGFDAATLLVAALKRQTDEGLAFQNALSSIKSYDGLTGRIEVGNDGEIRRAFSVVELKRGKIMEVTAMDNASFALQGNVRSQRSASSQRPTL